MVSEANSKPYGCPVIARGIQQRDATPHRLNIEKGAAMKLQMVRIVVVALMVFGVTGYF
jgi:hypothetical protein